MIAPDKNRAMTDLRCAGTKLAALFNSHGLTSQANALDRAVAEAARIFYALRAKEEKRAERPKGKRV